MAEKEEGGASVAWHNQQYLVGEISQKHTSCCRGVTCESAGCTTDCSHRDRRSNSAALLRPPCSPLAGSTHSASNGPATKTHSGYQQEDSLTPLFPLYALSHRGVLWYCVCPAGSHGAHNAPAGIHLQVPPRQDNLCLTVRLGHKLGRMGLKRAAHQFAEIHTESEEERGKQIRKLMLENGKRPSGARHCQT